MTKGRKFPVSKEHRSFQELSRTILLPASLILLFAIQGIWHARDKSATYDETGHLTVSALLAKTDHSDYDVGHPPLIRYLFSIPLLVLDPSLPAQMAPPKVPKEVPLSERPSGFLYHYSSYFVYTNRVPAERLIFWSRIVSVVLGCLLAFWIFKWSSLLYGPRAGLLSLAAAALCPNLIAHGSLITTDMGGVAFAIGFLYAMTLLAGKSSRANILFTGALMGLALLSKYTNLFLIPFFILAMVFLKRRSGEQEGRPREIAKTAAAVLFIAWFVVCLGYKFQGVFSPHTLTESDWQRLGYGKEIQMVYRYTPLPDTFLRGICFAISHDDRGHGAFFMGDYSSTGWWNYFPAAFLLKTPLVILLLISVWIYFAVRRRDWFTPLDWVAIVPAVILLATSMTAKVNIGLRHILLCYPIAYVLLGKLAALPFLNTRRGRITAGVLALLLAVETFSVAPHYLAFFNRASGGPANGIEYLSDSNIDWGQDLKNLSRFLKDKGDPEILLSYFGTAVPQYYGIRYQALPTVWSFPKSEHINSLNMEKEYLAVSVTNLQGTYFARHDLYGWLREMEPVKKIGYSIYVYDITNDPLSQQKILEIYRMTGERAKISRQVARLNGLSH